MAALALALLAAPASRVEGRVWRSGFPVAFEAKPETLEKLLEDLPADSYAAVWNQSVDLSDSVSIRKVPLRSVPSVLTSGDSRIDPYILALPRFFSAAIDGRPAALVLFADEGTATRAFAAANAGGIQAIRLSASARGGADAWPAVVAALFLAFTAFVARKDPFPVIAGLPWVALMPLLPFGTACLAAAWGWVCVSFAFALGDGLRSAKRYAKPIGGIAITGIPKRLFALGGAALALGFVSLESLPYLALSSVASAALVLAFTLLPSRRRRFVPTAILPEAAAKRRMGEKRYLRAGSFAALALACLVAMHLVLPPASGASASVAADSAGGPVVAYAHPVARARDSGEASAGATRTDKAVTSGSSGSGGSGAAKKPAAAPATERDRLPGVTEYLIHMAFQQSVPFMRLGLAEDYPASLAAAARLSAMPRISREPDGALRQDVSKLVFDDAWIAARVGEASRAGIERFTTAEGKDARFEFGVPETLTAVIASSSFLEYILLFASAVAASARLWAAFFRKLAVPVSSRRRASGNEPIKIDLCEGA